MYLSSTYDCEKVRMESNLTIQSISIIIPKDQRCTESHLTELLSDDFSHYHLVVSQ